MRVFVGVTDLEWYRQLSAADLRHDEVNFWLPSPRQGFSALSRGQAFLFKTHVDRRSPELSNRLVGLGSFSGYARLPISEAWQLFGAANGVESETQLRARIEKYRKSPIGTYEDPKIGAVLLRDVVFFSPSEVLPPPSEFALNLTRGRTYDLAELSSGESIFEAMLRQNLQAESAPLMVDTPTIGEPLLTSQRVGQQAFKALVAENYGHHCAITGDKVRPVLEAAHILPVAAGGQHRLDNGLLLRSDIHTLFDRGYIGVDTQHRLRVSPALREQFGNGDWFYSRQGMEIALPSRKADRPAQAFLEWHNDVVFQA